MTLRSKAARVRDALRGHRASPAPRARPSTRRSTTRSHPEATRPSTCASCCRPTRWSSSPRPPTSTTARPRRHRLLLREAAHERRRDTRLPHLLLAGARGVDPFPDARARLRRRHRLDDAVLDAARLRDDRVRRVASPRSRSPRSCSSANRSRARNPSRASWRSTAITSICPTRASIGSSASTRSITFPTPTRCCASSGGC